jgi:hypothetical protein
VRSVRLLQQRSHLLACVCFCCGMPCVLKLVIVIVIVIVLMFMLMLVLIATYLTLASLTLPSVVAFPFPQTLYRKRHFSDGPPILVACRLPSLPERCTSLHRFVAALGKLWQLLAVPKLRVQHQSRREDPGKRQPYGPHTTRRRHNRTTFPPSGLKEPNNGNRAYGGVAGFAQEGI